MLQIKLTEVAGGWILETLSPARLAKPKVEVFTARRLLLDRLEQLIQDN